MAELKIADNMLIADGETYPLNPYGYGEWVVLQTTQPPYIHRRYATDADLSTLLGNPNFSVVPLLWEQFPQYSSQGSIFIWKAGEWQVYLIAPKYTGHTPLTYTVGGKGVPRR